MADVFVSYARTDEAQAKRVAEALRALGYRVWRDDELPAHRAYAEVIEERLKSARGGGRPVVGRSREIAMGSGRSGCRARTAERCPGQLDGTVPPMPFNQIQCADLKGWDGSTRNRRAGRSSWPASRRWRATEQPKEPPGARRQDVGLRAAVREHERRCRAGIFQRRHQRGHHHRFVESVGAWR